MANLATISNNLLADSGIDPLSLVVGTGVANQIAYWTDDSTVAALSTTTYPSLTELSYVKGVTSSIQTQINAKQNTLSLTTTGNSGAATLVGATLNIPEYGTALVASGGLLTQGGDGKITYASAIAEVTTGLFPTSDNSNAVITINRHPGNYYSQLGFNSTGTIFYRSFNAAAINTTTPWQTLLTSSNYNSYSPTLTGGGASGDWGINITGTAGSETLATVTSRGAVTTTTLNLDGRVNIGNSLTRPAALNSDAVAQARIGGADVHLYIASLGLAGGYKVAMQAARTSDFQSFDLDLQSNGGTLRYGGIEVVRNTGTWDINVTGSAGSVAFNNITSKTGGTGSYKTTGDFTAPIFYDSADPGYYLDPNAMSSLRALTTQGGIAQFGLYRSDPAPNFGPCRTYLRIHPTASGARIISFKITINSSWNWIDAFGFISADVSFYFDGTSLYAQNTTVTSATGRALINLSMGAPVIVDGYVAIPIYSNNTNPIAALIESGLGATYTDFSFTAWESVAFPGQVTVTVPGAFAAGQTTISSLQDGKLILSVPSSDTNDWNYIEFKGRNGVRDAYFGTDSDGNPTWFRDDNNLNITLGSTATVNGVQIVTNSGTWGINITGNAATATTASNATQFNGLNFNGVSGRFTGDLNTLGLAATSGIYNIGTGYTNGPAADLYGTLFGIWNSDISVQFWASYNGDFYWRKSVGNTYTDSVWRTLLDSNNYTTYTVTKAGAGATGTWGINITGNANTATSATSATTAGSTPLLTASAVPMTTQFGNGTIGYVYALNYETTAGIFPSVDNSNSIITLNRHPDNYYSQLGFSSNGNMYYRSFSAATINTTQAWRTVWDSGNLTPQTQLNGTGFVKASGTTITYDNTSYLPLGGGTLSGLLSIQTTSDFKLRLVVPSGDTNEWNYIEFVGSNGVRDAYLGTDSIGTPTWYNDATGTYITVGSTATVNGTQIVTNSGTWGISITGNAATSTTAGSTPLLTASAVPFTNQFGNGTIGYVSAIVNPSTGLFPAIDNSNSIITLNRHPDNYYSQLGFSSNGNLYYRCFRAAAINTTEPWQTLLTSSNYNSYSPTLTGGGASGNWGINITGTAASETLATVTGRGATTSTTLNLTGRVNIGEGLARPDALNSDAVAQARIGGSDVFLYVASLGPVGGYKVAMQAARTSDFASFDLDLQSNGGTLRYGGTEVVRNTGTWGINVTGSAGSVAFNNITSKTGGTGTYQTSGDFRAPIFYDSVEPTYYVDPNSLSVLKSLTTGGGYVQYGTSIGGPAANFGPGRVYMRVWPTSSGARIMSFKMTISSTWNWAAAFGFISADVSFYFDGTNLFAPTVAVTSATGYALGNLSIGGLVIENGYVSVPIYSANTNPVFVNITGAPSFDWGVVTWGSWESVSFPGQVTVSVPGAISIGGNIGVSGSSSFSGPMTISTSGDGQLTLRTPAGEPSEWNYIQFALTSGTRRAYFGLDGGGTPQWYNDATGVYINLGSTANVNGNQIVTNGGNWSINTSGYSQVLKTNTTSLTTQGGDQNLIFVSTITGGTTGLFPNVDNSNAIITLNRHPDNYYSQLGFSSNGNMYYRSFSAEAINTTKAWRLVLDSSSAPYAANMNQYVRTTDDVTFNKVTAVVGFFESSDMRIKNLIEDEYANMDILNVSAKLYRKNGQMELGYFAQDFESILPSSISISENGFYELSYRQVHTAKIAALEKRIKELEQQIKNK